MLTKLYPPTHYQWQLYQGMDFLPVLEEWGKLKIYLIYNGLGVDLRLLIEYINQSVW